MAQVLTQEWIDKNVPKEYLREFYEHFQRWEPDYQCRHSGTYDEGVLQTMLNYAKGE